MWGPEPWGAPMWGFWWIFPLIGLLLLLACVVGMFRFVTGRGKAMCMGGHERLRTDTTDEVPELRREIQALREELRQLKAGR